MHYGVFHNNIDAIVLGNDEATFQVRKAVFSDKGVREPSIDAFAQFIDLSFHHYKCI